MQRSSKPSCQTKAFYDSVPEGHLSLYWHITQNHNPILLLFFFILSKIHVAIKRHTFLSHPAASPPLQGVTEHKRQASGLQIFSFALQSLKSFRNSLFSFFLPHFSHTLFKCQMGFPQALTPLRKLQHFLLIYHCIKI